MEKGQIKYVGKPHGLVSSSVYWRKDFELSLDNNSVHEVYSRVQDVVRVTDICGMRSTDAKLPDSSYFVSEISPFDVRPSIHVLPQCAELCTEQQGVYESVAFQIDSCDKRAAKLVEEEERQEGKVQAVVYWSA